MEAFSKEDDLNPYRPSTQEYTDFEMGWLDAFWVKQQEDFNR